jgi:hypothetical protein
VSSFCTIMPGTILPTGLLTRYGIVAGRLWTILSAVLISPFVISISLDLLDSTWLQAISNRRRLEASCHLLATDMTSIFSTPE